MAKNTLFAPPKSKRIAKIIDITNPTAFKRSIVKLKKGGLSGSEKKGLVLAKNRASAQLKRKNLSIKERKQFRAITKINLPKVDK